MSTQISDDADPWQIFASGSRINVWCSNAHSHDGQDLTPAQALRMADQLLRAVGSDTSILPPPPYDRTPDIRLQALDMAIRALSGLSANGKSIVTYAKAFESYLTSGDA